eukprot:8745817-Heterocapsa_arctica.AAC.1
MQDQQHIAETENAKEDEVHAQEEHQMEDDIKDTQIFGEQTENEHKIAEIGKVEQNTGKHTDQERKYIYPRVSNQRRFIIRAEQLFKEGQANKAIQKQEALKQKLQTKANKELRTLAEGDNKRQQVDGRSDIADDKQKHKLTCIASVGHGVDRIN